MSAEEKKPKKINIDIEIDSPTSSDEIVDDLAQARGNVSITRRQANDAEERLVQSGVLDRSVDLSAGRDDHIIAMLCYFFPFIMSLIVLLSESGQSRPFQRYHAVQGLGLASALAILGTGVGVFASAIWVIPIIGWIIGGLLFCLSPIGFAMGVLAHVYYGYQAYKGRRFSIPIISNFLKSQGWL